MEMSDFLAQEQIEELFAEQEAYEDWLDYQRWLDSQEYSPEFDEVVDDLQDFWDQGREPFDVGDSYDPYDYGTDYYE
jgi:hypothetical protein